MRIRVHCKLSQAIKLAKKAKGEDEHGYRAEFIQMVKLIDGLED